MADSAGNYSSSSLVRLSDADYDVAPGEHDVRGWEVCLANDEKIGEVEDLIIDPSAGKVRYLDVELDREAVGIDNDRHVLVPIATAQLDTDDEEVVLSGLSRAALLKLPEYDGKEYGGDRTGDGKQDGAGYDQTFQSHLSDDLKSRRITRSAEELRIGKRAGQTGEVRVSKHIETEHVKQTVPLRSEEVHVERRPVNRAVDSAAEMRNDEIVVPVIEEEAVIEKRPVVKEEIVISKEVKTTDRTVEADVRREEVDVKPSSENIRVKDDVKESQR
jgi:uncharacterized protein (TIGR02271 family)